MKNNKVLKTLLFHLLLLSVLLASYPDQQKVIRAEQMWSDMASVDNIVLSDDGNDLHLTPGSLSGSFILNTDAFPQAFDRGLPSWNGQALDENSGFKVFMRFRQGTGWSPWLTVGFWKNNIWPSYGTTSFSGGYIDYDYVVLNDFHTEYQWSVHMKRGSATDDSPLLDKLSFFVSDDRTTQNVNHSALLADNPPELFYTTSFIRQYDVDPLIGGDICSPTSTVFAIRSYGIEVDPYTFAVDNYDPYFSLFGIWPRAVQNAAEFNLDGAVTRYRSWSQAYDTLAVGGRIVISVGLPLYSGHLMMLAGFDASGNPIVHDPAKSNGYAYKHNKSDLARSWFDKGGVAYTFFQKDAATLSLDQEPAAEAPEQHVLYQNYPNPFNHSTVLRFSLAEPVTASLKIFDINGRLVETLAKGFLPGGEQQFTWNSGSLAAGVYLLVLDAPQQTLVRRLSLVK